jgi:hypothetical protein
VRPHAQPADSRLYIVALALHSTKEVPDDFELPGNIDFSRGVFLPGAEAGWFETAAYPPRVVLASPDAITIISHPASGESMQIIPLREIQFTEYAHMLLVGWILIASAQGARTLLFNTRTSGPVEDFLRGLMNDYAPAVDLPARHAGVQFGADVDLKFRNAERNALVPEERVLVRLFNATRQTRSRAWGILPIQSHDPADYLALTNRRLLWITERNRAYYDPYGIVQRSAPIANVAEVSIHHTGRNCGVLCRFVNGGSWCIPLPNDQFDAGASFAVHASAVTASIARRETG